MACCSTEYLPPKSELHCCTKLPARMSGSCWPQGTSLSLRISFHMCRRPEVPDVAYAPARALRSMSASAVVHTNCNLNAPAGPVYAFDQALAVHTWPLRAGLGVLTPSPDEAAWGAGGRLKQGRGRTRCRTRRTRAWSRCRSLRRCGALRKPTRSPAACWTVSTWVRACFGQDCVLGGDCYST